jgi:FAD/FMN-containing dehydrogenase
MIKVQPTKLADWGNFPSLDAILSTPDNLEDLQQYVRQQDQLTVRGNGKCYGDAALGKQALSTLAFNRLLHFDANNGIIECESGTLLADLLPIIVPAGWFFHVTPGIKSITVGGAIASDVHGKNHPVKGCFSNWLLSFDLLRGDGTVISCTPTQNADLFWQTCGGMGWTGIVLSAKFQLMRLPSAHLRQMNVRAPQLAQIFEAFEEHEAWSYAAAWIDCTASGSQFGRGAVFFANHLENSAEPGPLVFEEKPKTNIPFYAPSWFLNPLSIRMHNAMYHAKAKKPEHTVTLDQYFYPLDRVQNWNRFYGRRGFIQYQFCLPTENALAGISELLKKVRNSKDTPFLSVLKRHGARRKEAIHSFPIEGYSLALDFPRTQTIARLVPVLDDLIWEHGGKIYLAKDALSAPKMGRVDPTSFGEAKFSSLLKERITV